MVKKLQTSLAKEINAYSMTQNHEVAGIIIDKINEIIDLLNAIVVDVDGTKCIDGSKAPADPYAEHRKWIGKLCKFWDDDPNDYCFDKLKEITLAGCYIKENGYIFEYCEPISPDDDIIYKGE